MKNSGSDDAALGRMIELDDQEIRRLWPNEERDLSPLVRENIDLLNETLGLQIDIEEAESPVGSFRLDLAGSETTTQRPVVIENQYGSSDHDHLGKLITYAAGERREYLSGWPATFGTPIGRLFSGLTM